ncbi:MAG: tetratricopeptide repeat protein [Zetaproteobacteria bacterium]|nr:MAG: tetratricopeptide repeat protein [Zetaproteobacteria bacterium]
MRRWIAPFGIMLAFALAAQLAPAPRSPSKEAAYRLPTDWLEKAADGYRTMAAAVRWMFVLDRFGGEPQGAHDYAWLARELDLITRWNPRAEHAYFMGAVVLPWGTGSTRLSVPLLERAMRAMPEDWRWPFYRGFNAYWFDRDRAEAARLLEISASKPGAPPFVARLAARMHASLGDLDAALAFLERLYRAAGDEDLRRELMRQILAVRTEKVLRRLDRAIARIPPERRSRALLKRLGLLPPEPLPDGGIVVFTPEGVPVSSKMKKRFRLFVPPRRRRD